VRAAIEWDIECEHEKINSISPSVHVLFCLLYKHATNDVFDDFPKISDHFPKISEDFPKLFGRLDLFLSGFAVEFAGYVWRVAVSGKKKLGIWKYPDTCGRGLNLYIISAWHCRYDTNSPISFQVSISTFFLFTLWARYFFIVVLFLLVISLVLFKLDCILIIAFQFEPASTIPATNTSTIIATRPTSWFQ